MSKFRALMEKRDKYKDQIELAFAVFTIVSYVYSKVQERHSEEEEPEEAKEQDSGVYNISSL